MPEREKYHRDTYKYTVDFDNNYHSPQDEVLCSTLKMKGSTMEEKVDYSPWEESSVEGERILMRS